MLQTPLFGNAVLLLLPSQTVTHAGALFCALLSCVLGALLKLFDALLGSVAVGLDGFLAVGGELGLPVTLALLLLLQGVDLVCVDGAVGAF